MLCWPTMFCVLWFYSLVPFETISVSYFCFIFLLFCEAFNYFLAKKMVFTACSCPLIHLTIWLYFIQVFILYWLLFLLGFYFIWILTLFRYSGFYYIWTSENILYLGLYFIRVFIEGVRRSLKLLVSLVSNFIWV